MKKKENIIKFSYCNYILGKFYFTIEELRAEYKDSVKIRTVFNHESNYVGLQINNILLMAQILHNIYNNNELTLIVRKAIIDTDGEMFINTDIKLSSDEVILEYDEKFCKDNSDDVIKKMNILPLQILTEAV